MINIDLSEISILVTWPVLTNQRSVFRSRDPYCPIRGQYSGHVISINQSGSSIQVTRQVLTNYRSVIRSRDQYWPIRDQYSGHVTIIDQSEISIQGHLLVRELCRRLMANSVRKGEATSLCTWGNVDVLISTFVRCMSCIFASLREQKTTYLLIKKVLTRVHQEGQGRTQVVSQLRRSGVTHLRVQPTLGIVR